MALSANVSQYQYTLPPKSCQPASSHPLHPPEWAPQSRPMHPWRPASRDPQASQSMEATPRAPALRSSGSVMQVQAATSGGVVPCAQAGRETFPRRSRSSTRPGAAVRAGHLSWSHECRGNVVWICPAAVAGAAGPRRGCSIQVLTCFGPPARTTLYVSFSLRCPPTSLQTAGLSGTPPPAFARSTCRLEPSLPSHRSDPRPPCVVRAATAARRGS